MVRNYVRRDVGQPPTDPPGRTNKVLKAGVQTSYVHSSIIIIFKQYANHMADNSVDRNTRVHLFADNTKLSSCFPDVSERHIMPERLNGFMRSFAQRELYK